MVHVFESHSRFAEALRARFKGNKKTGILQVQSHLYSQYLIDVRKDIVAKIEQTHNADWSYPFVWEQWTAK